MGECDVMASNLEFYRERAAVAAAEAAGATSQPARERCEQFASWWSALGDAVEAGDTARGARLAGNVTYLQTGPSGGRSYPLNQPE